MSAIINYYYLDEMENKWDAALELRRKKNKNIFMTLVEKETGRNFEEELEYRRAERNKVADSGNEKKIDNEKLSEEINLLINKLF
jgi:hypothetical protein